MEPTTSTLLIAGNDAFRLHLLAKTLQEAGSRVGLLVPDALDAELYPGMQLFDARRMGPSSLDGWFTASDSSRIVDLGAFQPESIDFLRQKYGSQISHYIFCSSTSLYAPHLLVPIREDAPLANETSELLAAEKYLREHASVFPSTILRSSPIYGEGKGLVSYFFDRILFGDGILCPRSVEDVIQPLYVGDWVECILALLASPENTIGLTLNVAGKEWMNLADFCEKAAQAAYAPLRLYSLPAGFDLHALENPPELFPFVGAGHQIYSTDKLLTQCEFEAQTTLETGLEQDFFRYLEFASEIDEPNLKPEKFLIESLGLEPYAPAIAPVEEAPQPESEKKFKAGQMGAPTRLGTGNSLPTLRRPRDPSELPPPPTPAEPKAATDQRLDEMVDMMLMGVNREGENETQLEMKDEILGGLHIKISQKNRYVRVSFGCKQRASRSAIEESFPGLRRKLEQRGYFVQELVAVIMH